MVAVDCSPSEPSKLSRICKTHKIQKRPLLHPPIAPSRKGSLTQKVVYVSSSSPFIATIKRVQQLLGYIEKRSGPQVIAGAKEREILAAVKEGVRRPSEEDREGVIIKGTGKAIEKVMRVALWWQEKEGITVNIQTGSVGAIDDVVERGADNEEVEESRVRRVSCLEVNVKLQ